MPGDAIFIPSQWWHAVQALEPVSALVNFWWRQSPAYMDTPLNTLMLALLSLRDLPPELQRDIGLPASMVEHGRQIRERDALWIRV